MLVNYFWLACFNVFYQCRLQFIYHTILKMVATQTGKFDFPDYLCFRSKHWNQYGKLVLLKKVSRSWYWWMLQIFFNNLKISIWNGYGKEMLLLIKKTISVFCRIVICLECRILIQIIISAGLSIFLKSTSSSLFKGNTFYQTIFMNLI